MDLSSPLATVAPTLDAGVLQVLAATTAGCTAAEVHRRLGHGSDEGVRKVLTRLVGQGVVDVETPARYPVYQLNREHVAVPHIEALTRVREELLDRIGSDVASWTIAPTHAGLFGSFAKGTADSNSDIDVLLVRPTILAEADEATWLAQVDSLDRHIRRWTGNAAQIIDLAPAVLGRMAAAADPLVDSLRADDIAMYGERIVDLLRKLRRPHAARVVSSHVARVECREHRDQARAFLEVAHVVLTEDRREAHVAAALAVLAGIAAADAICGLKLRKWSRGQDHAQAVELLSEVALRESTLPAKLRRLLADKDAAHYSPNLISVDKAKTMVRNAAALLTEADLL